MRRWLALAGLPLLALAGAADEGIAGHEGIAYPPGTTWYEGSASQGYGPAGTKARRAKKSRPAAS